MFHVSCFDIWWCHEIWISEKLKSDYPKDKRSFRVLKVISFRHKKGTSRNVTDRTLKDCVRYFSFFPKKHPLINTYKKCFSFQLKSSFWSHDIETFVFPSSPLFPPVSHCLRGWLKINLKVYDVSSCINKNLKVTSATKLFFVITESLICS